MRSQILMSREPPYVTNDDECSYIHFLRLLAVAVDGAFQRAVNESVGRLLVGGGTYYGGGIKGYVRMYNKMRSYDDHFHARLASLFERITRPDWCAAGLCDHGECVLLRGAARAGPSRADGGR